MKKKLHSLNPKPSCIKTRSYRWDIFIAHDMQSLLPQKLTFQLFNDIDPKNYLEKMQYGVKVMVDNEFEVQNGTQEALNATSIFAPSSSDQALDNLSIWSGCGTKIGSKAYLYYTGVCHQELALMENPDDSRSLGMIPQRMFGASSLDDGVTWERMVNTPLVDLNSRENQWYERDAMDNEVDGVVLANSACRDPFVYQATSQLNLFDDSENDIEQGKFYLLFTARSNGFQTNNINRDKHFRGCIGVASSTSAEGPFKLQKPILDLGLFGDMELPHLVFKDGGVFLFFCVQDKCIDGTDSTDTEFVREIGSRRGVRYSYGYRFDGASKSWVPMNSLRGWIDTPAGIYGIRIFQNPDNKSGYGARGFILPSSEPRADELEDFSLSPLMSVEWPENGFVKVGLT